MTTRAYTPLDIEVTAIIKNNKSTHAELHQCEHCNTHESRPALFVLPSQSLVLTLILLSFFGVLLASSFAGVFSFI